MLYGPLVMLLPDGYLTIEKCPPRTRVGSGTIETVLLVVGLLIAIGAYVY